MNLNALQKYILKIFVVVIIFFTFCVPTFQDTIAGGHIGYGFVFIDGTVNSIAYSYLAYEFVGITLAALALVIACKEDKKK